MQVVVIAVVVVALVGFVADRRRRRGRRVCAHAALAPLLSVLEDASVPERLPGSGELLLGRYRGYEVQVELIAGERFQLDEEHQVTPAVRIHFLGDRIAGEERWELGISDGLRPLHGRRWKLSAPDDALSARLATSGLLERMDALGTFPRLRFLAIRTPRVGRAVLELRTVRDPHDPGYQRLTREWLRELLDALCDVAAINERVNPARRVPEATRRAG